MQLNIVEALIGIIGSLILFFLGLIAKTQGKHSSHLEKIMEFISGQKVTNDKRDEQMKEVHNDIADIKEDIKEIDNRLVTIESDHKIYHKLVQGK